MENFITQHNIPGIIMPDYAMKRPMSSGAKMLYAFLCHLASDKDHCWSTQKTLATQLSCSVSSIKTYLRELVEQKLIYIDHKEHRTRFFMLLPEELKQTELSKN